MCEAVPTPASTIASNVSTAGAMDHHQKQTPEAMSEPQLQRQGSSDPEKALDNATVDNTASPETQSELVEWDGPDDPEMPLNWPKATRWFNVVLVATLTFLTLVSLPSQFVELTMTDLRARAIATGPLRRPCSHPPSARSWKR